MEKTLKVELEGIYGKYVITPEDRAEVKNYRIALLICGISFFTGLNQWIIIGPSYAWIWFIPMSIALGFALKWIHIYLQGLHKVLKALWGIGCLGIIFLLLSQNSQEMLANIASRPMLTIFLSPFFAALTGVGFKEFFCFQRPEAIGLTLLLPISLSSHFFELFNKEAIMSLLFLSGMLLLILSFRKFGMDPASDIGDKSVFEYLKNKENNATSKIQEL